MQRTAMNELLRWKESERRKPLVVNGARQVGKTWLVCEFARQHFKEIAHVVFLDNEEMRRAFSGSLDPDRLLTIIGATTGTNPQSGETLVFFDEIQECPRAITSLKLFCEQRPEVPLVAAGSLLGVALNKGASDTGQTASWPVGKVNYLDLHPMTFDEYVAAVAGDSLSQVLRSGDYDLMDTLSERLGDLLRTYLYVGGMPEVVKAYVDTKDFSLVRTVQMELLNGYERDFSKHVESPLETERLRQSWRSAASQLARESELKRFSYAAIRQGGRGRDYKDAIAWLIDAGLLTKVSKISKPFEPLSAYADDTYFKLYLLDVGLLGAMVKLSSKVMVQGSRLFTEYKGAYAEQYVCQQLVAGNKCTPFYWSADGKQAKGEVDFVVDREGTPLPIEVKAGENVTGSSLATFVRKYDIPRSIRFSMKGYKDQGWLVNVPLYAANAFFADDARRG